MGFISSAMPRPMAKNMIRWSRREERSELKEGDMYTEEVSNTAGEGGRY